MSDLSYETLVPKKRFPEFFGDGAWVLKRFGEIATVVASGDLDTALFSPIKTTTHTVPVYSNAVEREGLYGYYITAKYPQNSISITARGNLGHAFYRKITFMGIGRLIVAYDFKSDEPRFVKECWNYLVPIPQEVTSIPQLTAVAARARLLPLPILKEQQKIADCLSSFDDLITAQNQKVEALKQHKKGLMQQLFRAEGETVPKLRFPEFENAQQWAFLPLNKLAKRCTQKNRSAKITKVLTNSAEFGVVDQRDYFDKDIATQGNLEGYFIVEKGDYVYNPRISAMASVGPISKNNIATGVMSPLYTVFRFENDRNDFYAIYFKTTGWHHYMRQSSSTGARHDRMAISNDAFMTMPIPVPSPEEQQKITNCLTSLDNLICNQMQKLKALREQKKGLMQKLFPSLVDA